MVLAQVRATGDQVSMVVQVVFWFSLAAGVLAPIGFVLSPAVGAILMSASTIVVALNAQLLRRINLDPGHLAPLGAPRPEAALQPATS